MGLLTLAACAAPDAVIRPEQPEAGAAAVKIAPLPDTTPPAATPEAARALLVQAEVDIQQARSRRALWSKAWESLLAARASAAAHDNNATVRHARRATELAQLGMEQLAYPPVR